MVPVSTYSTIFEEMALPTPSISSRTSSSPRPIRGVFDHAAYLNVNVPVADGEPASVELTRPSQRYEMDAERNGGQIHLHDRVWESMDPDTIPDPDGTDRRAIAEGRISITPLTAPHTTNTHDSLEQLIERYSDASISQTDV